MSNDELNELFEQARRGRLPKDFDSWELADGEGFSVAHAAARFWMLPPGFDRWEIADKRGWTVLREARRAYRRVVQGVDLQACGDSWREGA